MTWGKLLRIGAELALDLIREALSPAPETPARGLPFRDVEIQARASRNAGHEPAARTSAPAPAPKTPPG